MGYAFISYSSKQQKDADSLRILLQTNKINTWMAPYDIPDGDEYGDVIHRAIQDASCVVLLLTEDTQNSVYVDKEIERALHYGKTITPIQIDSIVLNDSFSFYLCNQQIVMVPAIDASDPQMQRVLQHLYFLCNNQRPSVEECVDKRRDKRTKRKIISQMFIWSGICLLCFSLFCGHRYLDMSSRVTYAEMYNAETVPEGDEITQTHLIFLMCVPISALAYLYGYGLRNPKKKTWNPFQILPQRQLLPVFSVSCGTCSAILRLMQRSIIEIIEGLVDYRKPVKGYFLPKQVITTTRILAILCITAAVISVILAFIHEKRNGYPFVRNLRDKAKIILKCFQRERWNVLPSSVMHQFLSVFSAFCGLCTVMLFIAQQICISEFKLLESRYSGLEDAITSLILKRHTLPQWVPLIVWIFASMCIITAVFSFFIVIVYKKRNGFVFVRSVRNKIARHWKRGIK